MRNFINRLAIVSLIGLPIAGAVAVPAGASNGVHFRVVGVHAAVAPSKIPNSNIIGQGRKARFSPDSIKFKEDTSGNDCTTGFVSFTITNTGTKTAFLTVEGMTFESLPPGQVEALCASGAAAGDQATFGLSNGKNTKTYPGALLVTAKD